MYNERPTVCQNATFAFGAYSLSDLGLLTAATFAPSYAAGSDLLVTNPAALQGIPFADPGSVVAAGILTAAFFKSSQFPLTTLFARSMEGPTPSSALGYAGLSAHVGVVLLATTTPLWFDYEWARILVGGGGALTTVVSSLIAQTRADRKGAIAYATSATLGQIFIVLAMGYTDAALVLSLGHAAYRMHQILHSPGIITETNATAAALGDSQTLMSHVFPATPPVWMYNAAWRLRRVDEDLTEILRLPLLRSSEPLNLTPFQQVSTTVGIATFAGFPLTPVSHWLEHTMMELLVTDPHLAAVLGLSHCAASVVLIRFLFSRVLDVGRFKQVLGSGGNRSDGSKEGGTGSP
jgi:formate hydrogenlyase subunit 3/multisubunit Na+/H+ antiporter MnhD subunit